jgi:tau tubulin kinase
VALPQALQGDWFRKGDVACGAWKVIGKIGAGTFSQIYEAERLSTGNTDGGIKAGTVAALKAEAPTELKSVLMSESEILLQMQGSRRVCEHHSYGEYQPPSRVLDEAPPPIFKVLVMELLGCSLSELRQRQPNCGRVPQAVAASLTGELFDCVQQLHAKGFVHRDIKPSNFAFRRVRDGDASGRACLGELCVIDFGLTKRIFSDAQKTHVAERPVCEFRGTSLYASAHAHLGRDLGRRDDMWSIFFILLDFLRGFLPWAKHCEQQFKDRPKVVCYSNVDQLQL